MHAAWSRAGAASLLAALLLPVFASSVSAECSNLAIDPIDRVQVGAAFLATATEVSDTVTPNPDGSDWNLHVRLSIDAVYYGEVPGTFEFNDWAGFGCGEFWFDKLEAGDQIIVAVEKVALSYLPAAPFEGHMVVWKKTSGGWSFFEDGLAFGSNPLFYPGAPRAATTKSAIRAVISNWTMPQTSTIDPSPSSASTPDAVVVFAFAVGLAIGLYRFRRGSRDLRSRARDIHGR